MLAARIWLDKGNRRSYSKFVMKATTIALMGLLLAMGSSQADLKIPRGVFKMDELAKAKAKAAESAKPLVFVLTDPGTT